MDKKLYLHAVMGCDTPYYNSNLEKLGVIKFNGNQHDCYNYIWVREQLERLRIDQLQAMYEAFSK